MNESIIERMTKMKKRSYSISLFVLVLMFSIFPYKEIDAKVKLNKKKVTIYVGERVKLKVKGTKKKVKWRSSNKKVATVTSKGKETSTLSPSFLTSRSTLKLS